jgi:alkylation response protein AidB-like acyl-CoA dehydrogenase
MSKNIHNYRIYMKNPGLQNYDLSTYNGLKDKNFFLEDSTLKRILHRFTENLIESEKKDIEKHIIQYGSLVGGVLSTLTEKSHKEGKYGEINKFNSIGERVDEIIYSSEQNESRKISYEYGIVNLDFHDNWKHPFHITHRYILAYLVNLNGEGGVACPLAMTDGMIFALKKIGTDKQKEKYLPLIAGKNSESHFFVGQYVTERVGGSNVGANRTIATKSSNGKWILNGEKWFCSNPGDLWVTTARIEGSNTIGMFLVSRYKESGELNGHHLLRKKDIIGSRGKVTAEVIYEDLEAEELGRPSHGLANLIKYIITISRIHVGIGASSGARRAVMEALQYAKHRTAYGKSLLDFFVYERNLCEMQIEVTALTFSNFRSISLWEKDISASTITIPLMKYISSSQATRICHSAILCLGGNGIIGDFSVLPRLLNDSIINESWEGTHFLLTEHILKAFEKQKPTESFFEEVETSPNLIDVLPKNIYDFQKEIISQLREMLGFPKEEREYYREKISDLSYQIFSLSNLIKEFEYDFEIGKKESIYLLFCECYVDLLKFGKSSVLPKNSKIMSKKNRELIINY